MSCTRAMLRSTRSRSIVTTGVSRSVTRTEALFTGDIHWRHLSRSRLAGAAVGTGAFEGEAISSPCPTTVWRARARAGPRLPSSLGARHAPRPPVPFSPRGFQFIILYDKSDGTIVSSGREAALVPMSKRCHVAGAARAACVGCPGPPSPWHRARRDGCSAAPRSSSASDAWAFRQPRARWDD